MGDVPARRGQAVTVDGVAHDVCDQCWAAASGGPDPLRVSPATRETCCCCGALSDSGIQVRAKPGTLSHCRGHGKRVYAGRGTET